jgi:anti-anti-sigma factor
MSVVKTAQPPLPETDTAFPSQDWESHTARATARWGRSGAVISIEGELDAANADLLAEYVHRCAGYCEWLVLNLRGLGFIGTAGFSVLEAINSACATSKVRWSMVPSEAVARMLRVCDPKSSLPTTESVAAALATVQERALTYCS